MSDPIRCLDCGYVLWGIPAGHCPECGRVFDPADPSTYSRKPPFVRFQYWLPGFLLATGGGVILYVSLIFISNWGCAVSLAAPFAVGAAIGYGCQTNLRGRVLLCLAAIIVIVTALFSLSLAGIFCGIILAVLMLIPTSVGMLAGVLLRHRLKRSQFGQRAYLPMLLLAISVVGLGVIERLTHRPYAIETVVTSIQIPAPLGRAWNSVMFYEEVHHSPPWLLRLGLPRPLYTQGSVAHVGDSKTCVYSKGHLTKRVTERSLDHRLAFDVIEQDHFENRSVRLTDGSFDFTPTAPDQTTVQLTTRYEPKLGPRWFWRPAEVLAVHTLHGHVLEGMRRKAAGEP